MSLSESDTRAKLIDPALHAHGWTEDLIRREETAGAVEIVDGQPRKGSNGRMDYTLRVKVTSEAQPVANPTFVFDSPDTDQLLERSQLLMFICSITSNPERDRIYM